MGLQILLLQINFGFFFLMVAARRFVIAIFVLAAMSSIMVIYTLGSQQRRSGCSVTFFWHTGIDILADGG
jgi:hypothetical protein